MQLFGFVSIMAAVVVLVLAIPSKLSKVGKAKSITSRGALKRDIRRRNPWRATSVVHEHLACDAVKAINNKRFLDTEKKVLLPLPDCEASICSCRYECHDDRREYNEDRRHPASLKSELYDETGETNRRYRKRGRRKLDWA
jgi:hypothetical protein